MKGNLKNLLTTYYSFSKDIKAKSQRVEQFLYQPKPVEQ